MNGNPDPVEVWAPMFLKHFTKEQILENAVTFNHCRLCDEHVPTGVEQHVRAHRSELTAYLAKKKREAAKRSLSGLAAARKEKQLQKEVLGEED